MILTFSTVLDSTTKLILWTYLLKTDSSKAFTALAASSVGVSISTDYNSDFGQKLIF